jgi:hypothetical protein
MDDNQHWSKCIVVVNPMHRIHDKWGWDGQSCFEGWDNNNDNIHDIAQGKQ